MEETPNSPSQPRPGVVLAMLLVVYTFNFLDRQILSILAQPVKADLGLTDAQMGALGGLAFAALFATMAIPLSLLADAKGRARVIGVSLAVWSGFTALCGLAGNFTQLFLSRLGVGIGEAGGVAPSYAIIAERFPPHSRARALAIYGLGVPMGSALGALGGAAIAQAVDWRAAFIVLGLAGLLAVIPFRLIVRDLPRAPEAEKTPPTAVFGRLARQPVFWLVSLGAGCCSLAGYGLAFWTPALLQRSFGLSLVEMGQFIGGQFLIGGTIGILLGGVLGDRVGRKDRAAYLRVPVMAYFLCLPTFLVGFFAPGATAAFFLLLLPSALSMFWLGPVTAAVQHLVPAQERATASACFLLINNGIGLGLGALVIGKLSDLFTPSLGAEALRHAMAWTTLSYVAAGVLMLLAAARLKAAWRD